MDAKATIQGHPIHPALVAFPLAFDVAAVLGFAMFNWFSVDAFWYRLGFFCTYAGVVMAVVAAIPGLIDWIGGIPRGTPAKARGLLHMGLNVTALALFAILAFVIRGTWAYPPENANLPVGLAFVGTLFAATAAYHGWNLVSVHKVGVRLTPEQERLEPSATTDSRAQERPLRPSTV